MIKGMCLGVENDKKQDKLYLFPNKKGAGYTNVPTPFLYNSLLIVEK